MNNVIDVIVDSFLIIEKSKLSIKCINDVKKSFTYTNPKFVENNKWGRSNYNTPKHLFTFQDFNEHFLIYRGGLEKLTQILEENSYTVKTIDRTYVGETVIYNSSKTILREDQKSFIDQLLKHDFGCGQGFTSFGKSLTMCHLIEKLQQRAVIIVHTTFLQKQWYDELTNPKTFNLDPKRIGGVGGMFTSRKDFYTKFPIYVPYLGNGCVNDINICLYQSFGKPTNFEKYKNIGVIIMDEGHISPIDDIRDAVNNHRARYKYSVSATYNRKDGKEFLVFDTFGPIRVIAKEKNTKSKILSKIVFTPSRFKDDEFLENANYNTLMTNMARDRERNLLICKIALRQAKLGKLVMIFVQRKEHAARLYLILSSVKGSRVEMLIGGVNKKEVSENPLLTNSVKNVLLSYDDLAAVSRVKSLAEKKKLHFIIGTPKSEVGLSIRAVDYGVLTTPINNIQRFEQIKGRLERTYSEEQEQYFRTKKQIPIFDVIVDFNIPLSLKARDTIKTKYESVCSNYISNKKTILRKKQGEE